MECGWVKGTEPAWLICLSGASALLALPPPPPPTNHLLIDAAQTTALSLLHIFAPNSFAILLAIDMAILLRLLPHIWGLNSCSPCLSLASTEQMKDVLVHDSTDGYNLQCLMDLQSSKQNLNFVHIFFFIVLLNVWGILFHWEQVGCIVKIHFKYIILCGCINYFFHCWDQTP